jgi:hypothetical protein
MEQNSRFGYKPQHYVGITERQDENHWRVDSKTISLINGPSVAERRQRAIKTTGNFVNRYPQQSLIPFNWLQLINIFLATLAVLLFFKLVSMIIIEF